MTRPARRQVAGPAADDLGGGRNRLQMGADAADEASTADCDEYGIEAWELPK
jgi:hypothetical protein